MKKIAIMQPYLFPYIGYFQVMKAADKYVIYDDVQYIKGGWINRNNFLIQGNSQLISIALKDASANKRINEIEIADNFVKFKKTIAMAYSRAPYVEPVMQLIDKICKYEDKNLAKFTGNSFVELAKYIEFNTDFVYSSTLQKDTSLAGQDKVVAICQELEADTYINSIGGQELYNKSVFMQKGITLHFLKTNPVEYVQLKNKFIPGLSIIDVLMFNSPSNVNQMLDSYELI